MLKTLKEPPFIRVLYFTAFAPFRRDRRALRTDCHGPLGVKLKPFSTFSVHSVSLRWSRSPAGAPFWPGKGETPPVAEGSQCMKYQHMILNKGGVHMTICDSSL